MHHFIERQLGFDETQTVDFVSGVAFLKSYYSPK
jgi:hypothetical protein